MGRLVLSALIALGVCLAERPVTTVAASVKRKIDLIRRDLAPPGSRVRIAQDELNAYARGQVAKVAPQGVREPRLVLGAGRATAYAYVDFPKLRQSQGRPMNWLLATLLAGERPVRIDARIRSGGGQAVVDLDRVEVSGIILSGNTLTYVIRNFLWPYYPDAKVGRPFELAHGIDRLEVRPSDVQVVIKR
jgi:hypothetical protein